MILLARCVEELGVLGSWCLHTFFGISFARTINAHRTFMYSDEYILLAIHVYKYWFTEGERLFPRPADYRNHLSLAEFDGVSSRCR